ncbi:MAG TPA: MoaD/ThiS family protein [Gemmatimonadales bacterium]|nr:MoaD/ThiS family protein [Gemmatimonadales bacterium]
MDTPARATVLLFARYAELAGADRVEVPIGPGTDVRRVLQGLRDELPGAAALPEAPLCAINHQQARLSDAVRPGDIVAFLPPLAGG